MNMLQVQDALKSASDDQLMREMMNPTGMAPQFLVLSEMKRRKDMRSKATPPQGTVAEDLMAEGNQAREAMTVSEDEPEYADEQMMARGGLAALRRYAEGGAVRMQAGGMAPIVGSDGTEYAFATPGSGDPIVFGRPLSSYSLAELERLRSGSGRVIRSQGRGAGAGSAGAVRRFDPDTGDSVDFNRQDLIDQRLALLRSRTETPISEEPLAQLQAAPLTATAPAGEGEGRGQSAAAAPSRSATDPTRGMFDTGENNPLGGRIAALPAAAARSGLGPLRAGLPALAPQPPAIRQELARAGDATPDRLTSVLNRINEGRTDAGSRRSDAINMALIEAGLRIAGSNSPRLAGAISEGGIPALQGFTQQSQQIRQDQRQDLRDELQTAVAANQNEYQRGRLSLQEMQIRNEAIANQARLAQGAAGNSLARERLDLERARQPPTLAQYSAMSETDRALADRLFRGPRDPQPNLLAQNANNLSDGMARLAANESNALNAARASFATSADIQAIQRLFTQERQNLEERYRRIAPDLFPQLPMGTAPREGANVVRPTP